MILKEWIMGKDRKRKNFYKSNGNFNNKRLKQNRKLSIGMHGILVTHDRNKEKSCIQDTFNVLNFFHDKWFNPEAGEAAEITVTEESKTDNEEEILDIESAIASEVEEYKGNADEKYKFYSLNSGCTNVIFIKAHNLLTFPSVFVQRIFDFFDSSTNEQLLEVPFVKNVLRMHPIDKSCRANLSDIKEMLEEYLPGALSKFENSCDSQSNNEFCVVFRRRNQDFIRQSDTIDAIIDIANTKLEKWSYNCRSDNVFLLIDIIGAVCCMSVVRNYNHLKKFNMREMVNKKVTEQNEKSKSKDSMMPRCNPLPSSIPPIEVLGDV